jgi:hypothetical protein
MHDFRRRPADLTVEQTKDLEDLFEKVPALGGIYHLRWRATKIFDTAGGPAAAARALNGWIAEARESPNRERLAVGTSDDGLEIWNLPEINAKLTAIGLGW